MKQIATNYNFDATAKTVTLHNLNVSLSQILMVAAKGKVLYSFVDGVGAANYVQGTNSVLTLQSTTGLTNADKLTIFYDDNIDSTSLYVNRYGSKLNYNNIITFGGVEYGVGKTLISENKGRNSIEVIPTSDVYVLFGETASDIYNKVGTKFNQYCETFGNFLSANTSYIFSVDKTTTGNIFVWYNPLEPLSYKANIIASENSSISTTYNTISSYFNSDDVSYKLIFKNYSTNSIYPDNANPAFAESGTFIINVVLSASKMPTNYYTIPWKIKTSGNTAVSAVSASDFLVFFDTTPTFYEPTELNENFYFVPGNQTAEFYLKFKDDLIDEGNENISFVTLENSFNFTIADGTNRQLAVTENVIYAGSTTSGFLNDNGTNARFYNIASLCLDSTGNIYVADSENYRIRKIDTSRNVTTYAGDGTNNPSSSDGTLLTSTFYKPSIITIDDIGNIYVGERSNDATNKKIRKISPSGNVSTIVSNINLRSIVSGSTITYYSTDSQIFKITQDGNISTHVSSGFTNLKYMCIDKVTGDLYVTDGTSYNNVKLKKVSSTGTVTDLIDYNTSNNTGALINDVCSMIYVNGYIYFTYVETVGPFAPDNKSYILGINLNTKSINYALDKTTFNRITIPRADQTTSLNESLATGAGIGFKDGYLFVGTGNQINKITLLATP